MQKHHIPKPVRVFLEQYNTLKIKTFNAYLINFFDAYKIEKMYLNLINVHTNYHFIVLFNKNVYCSFDLYRSYKLSID